MPALVIALGGTMMMACGSDESSADGLSPNPGSDASTQQDAAPDATSDAPTEAALEAAPEAAPDVVPAEAAPDAVPDVVHDGPGPDTGDPWPTCDTQPAGVPDKTISSIWQDNPVAPTAAWVTGLYVTAISKGACTAGSACQVFLQDAETFASLAAGAHHAIKLFISGPTAEHFTTLQVGDRVNVYAHAWRYNLNPSQNELLLQVNGTLRGCAKTVGSGAPVPVSAELTDLTVDAYENTIGPVLVNVATVTGKPGAPAETFALWKTGGPFEEAGVEGVVSASPYFLSGGAFAGLPTGGTMNIDFESITGVFGMFVPPADGGTSAKYLMLYPRSMVDMPVL